MDLRHPSAVASFNEAQPVSRPPKRAEASERRVGSSSLRTLDGLTRFALVLMTICVAAVHIPLIGYKAFANIDEAYASALAQRLLEGEKLYHGAVSQRGPLMYYIFEVIAWLHGWDNIVALRCWALGTCLVNLLLVFYVGRLMSARVALVAFCVTAYALAFGVPPYDALALHGESMQMPALLLATATGAFAMSVTASRRRNVLLLVTGLTFGVAAAIKQSVALHPLALCLWLAADAHRNRRPLRSAIGPMAWLVGGIAFVLSMFVVHAWANGTLHELYYYCVTYNRTVHLRPTTKIFPILTPLYQRLLEQPVFFLSVALVMGSWAPELARRARAARRERSLWPLLRGFGFRQYVFVHLVLALYAGTAMLRFFPHYFLQAIPFLALSLGALVQRWFSGTSTRVYFRPLVSAGLAVVLLCSALATVFAERVDGRVMHDRTPQDAGKAIAAITSPDDKIFVWGFSPWLYQYSHRRPAGRYVFSTYVTGLVPWFWEKLSIEKARIVPGSVEALLGDLDREKPEIVVDAGSVMMARPMRSYAKTNEWLHAHYCFEFRLGAFDIYRRKHDACAVPYFPEPSGAVDWSSRPLPMLVPVQEDVATWKRLPRGNYFKPLWFPEGQRPPKAVFDVIRDPNFEKDEREAQDEGFQLPKIEAEAQPCEAKPAPR